DHWQHGLLPGLLQPPQVLRPRRRCDRPQAQIALDLAQRCRSHGVGRLGGQRAGAATGSPASRLLSPRPPRTGLATGSLTPYARPQRTGWPRRAAPRRPGSGTRALSSTWPNGSPRCPRLPGITTTSAPRLTGLWRAAIRSARGWLAEGRDRLERALT